MANKPTWKNVKAQLESLDRPALVALIQDLYTADKDNQTFLHTRLGLGGDLLEPYKKELDRWLSPDSLRNKLPSVANAKKAIAKYRKAIGEPSGLAELATFYCECAVDFSYEYGYSDGNFFNALVDMFELALGCIAKLPVRDRKALMNRLRAIRDASEDFGYGVGGYMSDLLAGDAS